MAAGHRPCRHRGTARLVGAGGGAAAGELIADGRRYLLIHGDEFDQVTRHHRWIAVLGDIGYNGLVRVNAWLSWLRRRLNRPGYWSLAGYAKRKVKTAVSLIFNFEDSVIHAARERGVSGVICGHIHSATIRAADDIAYLNCGDWVDSCTAIVEHLDGRMELIHHAAPRRAAEPGRPPIDLSTPPGAAPDRDPLLDHRPAWRQPTASEHARKMNQSGVMRT